MSFLTILNLTTFHGIIDTMKEKSESVAKSRRRRNDFTSLQLLEEGLNIQRQYFNESKRFREEELKILNDISKFFACK